MTRWKLWDYRTNHPSCGGNGAAVLASHVGGIPEVVRHGEEGRLARPNDPDALSSALVGLSGDGAWMGRLASNPRKRSRREFSQEAKLAPEVHNWLRQARLFWRWSKNLGKSCETFAVFATAEGVLTMMVRRHRDAFRLFITLLL